MGHDQSKDERRLCGRIVLRSKRILRILVSMFVLLVFFAILANCHCETELSESARNFSVKLMYHTAEETQWHTAISPLGIWSLLTTVSIGATGSSRKQLLDILNLPEEKSTIVREHKNLINSVITPATPDIELTWNNFIFLDYGFATEMEFEQTIINDFGAKVTKIDFKSMAEAADYANSVIQESDKSISNVFQPDDFTNARMILTNTISFKGLWQFPFNASITRVQDFHDEMGNVIGNVNMMQQEGLFQYSRLETISAFVLELPYGQTNQYSFLVILPYSGVKLADVQSGVESFGLKNILNQMQADTDESDLADVVVNLPRFKISTNTVLNTPLMGMGLVDIFDYTKANFDLVSKTENLYVSAIVHNANIEVTEAGTLASAATSGFLSDRTLPLNFNANRPFLYLIIEKSTATIIFSGVYSIPMMY